MRLNNVVIKNNINDVSIEGRFTLTAAGAVVATFGDDVTTTKTGVGSYRVRISSRAVADYRVVETLYDSATFGSGTPPATAVKVRVLLVSTDVAAATKGDLLIDIVTANATWVATDTTAACSVNFRVSFRKTQVH
jgi:hypothetical protein